MLFGLLSSFMVALRAWQDSAISSILKAGAEKEMARWVHQPHSPIYCKTVFPKTMDFLLWL